MSYSIDLSGRVALITGASSGLGAQFARVLSQAGAAVVLGGRRSLAGPLLGAAILTALPELARPLAENRGLMHGLLLIAVICFLPEGIADTLGTAWKRRRLRNQAPGGTTP